MSPSIQTPTMKNDQVESFFNSEKSNFKVYSNVGLRKSPSGTDVSATIL